MGPGYEPARPVGDQVEAVGEARVVLEQLGEPLRLCASASPRVFMCVCLCALCLRICLCVCGEGEG